MELLAAQANKKQILAMVQRKTGKTLTTKDLHNLNTKRKKLLGSEGEQIKGHFDHLVKDRGALIQVSVDDDTRNVRSVTYSTEFMRTIFEICPQVVFVDSTFLVNANNYSLLGFMVQDPLGNGQLAQLSLQQASNAINFEEAVRHFKATQPRWKDIRVFVTDKDLTEVNVLERSFPDATTLLCVFHVDKWLREECSKDKYHLSMAKRDEFRAHLSLMIYAKDEETSEKYDDWLLEHILEVRVLHVLVHSVYIWKLTFVQFIVHIVCRAMWSTRFGSTTPRIGGRSSLSGSFATGRTWQTSETPPTT